MSSFGPIHALDSNSRTESLVLLILGAILLAGSFNLVIQAYAWSNGGYSNDPQHPKYGTHDWIAQHALDWLPVNVKEYITNNLALYLYGTELPDNNNKNATGRIGDTEKHHIYFFSNGTLQDDSAAVRAQEEYDEALAYLNANNFTMAAETAGIMTHYIDDVGVFRHVMGASTDWGKETHHEDYEDYVDKRTNNYTADFNIYLSFDGSLDNITAYEAAKTLAYDTTFGGKMNLTCVWMDNNYNWSNPTFRNRCGESLNLAVNLVADVLHTLYISRSNCTEIPNHVVINEFEQNPPGTDKGNEWVELYNPTVSDVNVSGWTLTTTHGDTVTVTIPFNTTIAADGYYVYGNYTKNGEPAEWLDNTDESIILRNNIRKEIDRTPSLSDNVGENGDYRCWARFPNGYDTNSSTDWRFQLATKGFCNGKWLSSISCYVNPAEIVIGSSTIIQGVISPIFTNGVVHIWYSEIGGNLTWLAEAWTNSSGGYQYEWTPSVAGNFSIETGWDGNVYYMGSHSTAETLVVWGNIPSNQTTHTGDLIINGTQTYLIENCTYVQTGNIIVRDNAQLIIRNAELQLSQSWWGQFAIQVNMSALFKTENALITSQQGFSIYVRQSAKAELNSTLCWYWSYFYSYDNSEARIYNSTIMGLQASGSSIIDIINSPLWWIYPLENSSVHTYDSLIQYLDLGFGDSAKATLTDLYVGLYPYWNLHVNETVEGVGYNLTFFDTEITSGWELACYDYSKVSIDNSTIYWISASGFSIVSVYNSKINNLYAYDNSNVTIYNCSINALWACGSSYVSICNSTTSDLYLCDYSSVSIYNSTIYHIHH
jgi:hypothetical protein